MIFSFGFIYLVARLARQLMKERGIVCMTPFSLSGSFGSVVDKRNLYDVKCCVHLFCGSFGSSGSAVDQRTLYSSHDLEKSAVNRTVK